VERESRLSTAKRHFEGFEYVEKPGSHYAGRLPLHYTMQPLWTFSTDVLNLRLGFWLHRSWHVPLTGVAAY